MKPTIPQPFIVREECHKAAWQHGFRRVLGESDGWAAFESTTAQGTIWLAAESTQGPWFLALDHPGVVAELALPSADTPGPGIDRYAFPTLTALYAVLPRIYQLSTSLPDAPLQSFQQQTAKLPKTTEAERLVVQRIGQDIFRASLMDYWQSRCPLTGIVVVMALLKKVPEIIKNVVSKTKLGNAISKLAEMVGQKIIDHNGPKMD